MLYGGERRGPGTAVVAGDGYVIRPGLRDAGGYGSDAHLGYELDAHIGARVGVLEVVDELGKVLDGVDVVVGRRGDQTYPWRRVAHPRYVLRDPVPRELAALAGLGPLGHLDLQHVRADEALGGDAEVTARYLLYGAAAVVPIALRIPASLPC